MSASAVYEIQLTFAANGPDLDFNVSVADETDPFNVSTTQGTVFSAANDIIGSLEFGTDTGFNAQFGDNYMSVTDVSLVPEPSYAFLCLFVGSFAIFVRRRPAPPCKLNRKGDCHQSPRYGRTASFRQKPQRDTTKR